MFSVTGLQEMDHFLDFSPFFAEKEKSCIFPLNIIDNKK
jgi:hypothetical protein